MFLKSCLTLCLMFVAGPSDEQATGKQSKDDDEVVAVMDSKEIHQSDIKPDEQALSRVDSDDREETIKRRRASNLYGFILTPLIQEYAKKHKIEATDAEIDSFNDHMDKALRKAAEENPGEDFPELDSDDPEEKKAKRDIERATVETWKVSKDLYNQYGGTVIF